MKKALLYKKLNKKKVKCQACNHLCVVSNGGKGVCGVRENKDGTLYSLVYAQTSGASIDPIEKKPLFHFMPNSDVFSYGTIGCNFSCDFCQNAWMSQSTKDDSIKDPPLHKLPPSEIIYFCKEKSIPIIAYTYNEPAISFRYSYDTAKLAHKNGIKNVFVSNGYATTKAIDKITPYLDAINIDLKAFSADFYKKRCGARLAPVLENIKHYHKNEVWVELTTLIIPHENDSEKELKEIAEFIASVSPAIPWHVIKFSPAYKMKDTPPTPKSTLMRAYEIGRKAGLKYIYAGNISDIDLHSTYCPKCKKLLIKRDWGFTGKVNIDNAKCSSCREKIKGVWK